MAVGTRFRVVPYGQGLGVVCGAGGRLILAAEGLEWFGSSLYQVLVRLVWRIGIS